MEQPDQIVPAQEEPLVGDFTVAVYLYYCDPEIVQIYKGNSLLPSSSSSNSSQVGQSIVPSTLGNSHSPYPPHTTLPDNTQFGLGPNK